MSEKKSIPVIGEWYFRTQFPGDKPRQVIHVNLYGYNGNGSVTLADANKDENGPLTLIFSTLDRYWTKAKGYK